MIFTAAVLSELPLRGAQVNLPGRPAGPALALTYIPARQLPAACRRCRREPSSARRRPARPPRVAARSPARPNAEGSGPCCPSPGGEEKRVGQGVGWEARRASRGRGRVVGGRRRRRALALRPQPGPARYPRLPPCRPGGSVDRTALTAPSPHGRVVGVKGGGGGGRLTKSVRRAPPGRPTAHRRGLQAQARRVLHLRREHEWR